MALTEGHDIHDAHQAALADRAGRTPADYYAIDPAPVVEGSWRIDDDQTAAWALRRIAEHRAEVERLQAAAKAERKAVDAWLDDVTGPPQRSIEHLEAALIDYRRRLEDENPRLAKTYRLPGGDLTRRAGTQRKIVTDQDALIEWAEANDPAIVKREPLVSRLAPGAGYQVTDGAPTCRVVTMDGEPVPGVEVVTGDDTYAVRLRDEPPALPEEVAS